MSRRSGRWRGKPWSFELDYDAAGEGAQHARLAALEGDRLTEPEIERALADMQRRAAFRKIVDLATIVLPLGGDDGRLCVVHLDALAGAPLLDQLALATQLPVEALA